MKENIENIKLLARDLRNDKELPRSPRETPRAYALAARALDKCRAALVGWQGEYDPNCPLDQQAATEALKRTADRCREEHIFP